MVDDGGNSISALVFSDIAPADVIASRVGNSDDLILNMETTGKSVTVRGEFSPDGTGRLASIGFGNGASWDIDLIKQAVIAGQGAAPSGAVYGFADGDDTLLAGSGNKYLNGLGGHDTYVYSSIGGNDVIDDGGMGSSKLRFSALDASDRTLQRHSGSNDLEISAGGGNHLTILGQFGGWSQGGQLGSFMFADGGTWTAFDISQHTQTVV